MDWLVAKVGEKAAKVLLWIVGILLVLAILFGIHLWLNRGQKEQIKLSNNQTGAAVASGQDAVATVGNRAAADQQGDATVRETQGEIDNATDAGGVTDAGRSGLCGLAGYRGRPECVQQPRSR